VSPGHAASKKAEEKEVRDKEGDARRFVKYDT
jgi:hypothetical protein